MKKKKINKDESYLNDASELNEETLKQAGEMEFGTMPLFSEPIVLDFSAFKIDNDQPESKTDPKNSKE